MIDAMAIIWRRKMLDSGKKVKINEGYELYQIITDFGDPLEIFREAIQNSFDADADEIYVKVYEKKRMSNNQLIIDIIDNGTGLEREKASNFFDLAYSTKIEDGYIPTGKHGYKGHGAKVFFNAMEVDIISRTKDGKEWAAKLEDPIDQIEDTKELKYSELLDLEEITLEIPRDWESGFAVRIVEPRQFNTEYTKFKLNHKYLRDYCNWYTIIGSIETSYNQELKDRKVNMFLAGLLLDDFKDTYSDEMQCDPVPVFKNTFLGETEIISLGHYFPDERRDDKSMKQYAQKIGSNKASYMYYSNMIYNEKVSTGNLTFRLIISLEGYETKRRYDLLLSRQGRQSTEENHTDGERYGLWACKGGVPVEKVDDWVIGGKGIGTYTYMQAFVDCDDFQLTANRGSIRNTNIEKLDIIKKEINRILGSKKVEDAIQERKEWENLEKTINSVDTDGKDLKKRYSNSKSKKTIHLPNGKEIKEPSKTKSGYSESETFVVLYTLMDQYPDLFKFNFMDYNTTKGIDFVVDENGSPKYIELKGTFTKKINHPYRYIYKFICYDIDVYNNDIVEDMEDIKASLIEQKCDCFESNDEQFNSRKYTSYVLQPSTATIQSMEVICLKSFLQQVIGATIQ